MGPVGLEISPRPLQLVVVVVQGGMALVGEGSLAAMVPDCSLGSPESNPPDWQVGRGWDSPVSPESRWAPCWSKKKPNKKLYQKPIILSHFYKCKIY